MFRSHKLSIVLFSSLFSFSALASYQNMGDEDVLFSVSKKLVQIEQSLESQTVSVFPETLYWPEIEEFTNDLTFIVAHDPHGTTLKNTPVELASDKLTERFRSTSLRLEESVYRIGTLAHSPEWIALKTDMEQFLQYRQGLLYQQARVMIKTGAFASKIRALRSVATETFSKSLKHGTKVSFRVSDPGTEALAAELKVLNTQVEAMKELRKPAPVEVPTIFKTKHAIELGLLAGGAFSFALALVGAFTLITGAVRKKKSKKATEEDSATEIQEVEPSSNQFDYDEWLKRLEKNLKALKKTEDVHTEDMLCLINYSHELRDARLLVNQATTQEEITEALKALNTASSKIETYFEKINFRKQSETSRNIMKHLVEICEAIENRLEMKVQEKEKTDLGLEVGRLKAA